MRIMVDENIPLKTVQALLRMGHDVLDVRGTPEEGIPDPAVWDVAQREKRMLITTDKGFSRRRGAHHFGILVIRLRQPNRERIHRRAIAAIEHVPESDWPGLLFVVRDTVWSRWRHRDPSL